MSFLHGASNVAISGGTQVAVAAAAGSSVIIGHGSSALKDLSTAAAHTAMHDSVARSNAPRCHRNTRAKYLDKFELWMLGQGDEFEGKRLIWLYGGAGAGKSAIMQSTVDRCAQHGVILGTFFFSRTDSSRNYTEILLPTLAYQVASSFPEAMAVLEPIINRNPLIFKSSLHTQAYELLVRPLRYLFETGTLDNGSPVRRVFIIDGLDECSNPQEQVLIIQAVTSILCDHHLPVNFMIASRPELTISSAFQKEKQLSPMLTTISLEGDHDAESDIRQFIDDSFLDILDSHPWRMHIRMPWPSPDSINHLVQKSSGHFIYVATAMKFIASSDKHPPRALEVVEGIEASRTESPFAELDALYTHILSSAKYSERVLDTLRLCYLSLFPNTVTSVCGIYNASPEDVLLFLSDVQSLVSLIPNQHTGFDITPKHASLEDFLRTESRSKGMHITRGAYYASLLPQYFHLVDTGLKPLGLDLEDDLHSLLAGLREGLVYSKDTKLLQSLLSQHAPNDIWKFCVQSLQLARSLQDDRTIKIRSLSTDYLCDYMRAVRQSTTSALHDDALYFHQFQMYIELVLDDLSDIMDRKPQYCIIPALMLSSQPSGLALAYHLLMFWHREFHIHISYLKHFPHLHFIGLRKLHPLGFDVIKRLPQSQYSWGAELAFAMTLVLQRLVHLSLPGPSNLLHTRASPHRKWLRKHKGLKHISLGSPKLSSTISCRLVTVEADTSSEIDKSHRSRTLPFLLSCWRRFKHGPFEYHHLGYIAQRKRNRSLILLKAVISYLPKSDCTSEIVRLARRLLPVSAQWHPKAMSRARAEMDAYVQRWDESPDGLLERAQLLSVNDMD